MNQNDSVVVEDLRDDAIVATLHLPENPKFTNERLAEPVRLLSNRAEDRLQYSVAHLLGESLETTGTLSRDLDLVHPTTSDVGPETQSVAPLSVAA